MLLSRYQKLLVDTLVELGYKRQKEQLNYEIYLHEENMNAVLLVEKENLIFFLSMTYSPQNKKSEIATYWQLCHDDLQERHYSIIRQKYKSETDKFSKEIVTTEETFKVSFTQLFKAFISLKSQPISRDLQPLNFMFKYRIQNILELWHGLTQRLGWTCNSDQINNLFTAINPQNTKEKYIFTLFSQNNKEQVFQFLKDEILSLNKEQISVLMVVQQGENPIFLAQLQIDAKRISKSKATIYHKNQDLIQNSFISDVQRFFQINLQLDDSKYSIDFIKSTLSLDEQHSGVEVTQIGLNIIQKQKQEYCTNVPQILKIRQSHLKLAESLEKPIDQFMIDHQTIIILDQKLLEFYLLLDEKQQRKFVQISENFKQSRLEVRDDQNQVLAKLEKFLKKNKDLMQKVMISPHQNLNEYLITQSTFIIRQDKLEQFKISLLKCMDHIKKELLEQQYEIYETLNSELNSAVYKSYLSEWNRYESKKQDKDDINKIDSMTYFYYENQLYCKTITGKLKLEGSNESNNTDYLCMLMQYIKLNFKLSWIKQEDSDNYDEELESISKKLLQKNSILDKQDIIKYLNQKYGVQLVDGSKAENSIKIEGQILFWPVFYQDDLGSYQTTLVKMDRIYTSPAEIYDYLLEIVERENSIYKVLMFLMNHLYDQSTDNQYQQFVSSLTDSLQNQKSVDDLWLIISNRVQDLQLSDSNPKLAIVHKHTYMMDTLIRQLKGVKFSIEKEFIFKIRNEIKTSIQEVNMQIIRDNNYKAYNQLLSLQLNERKFEQEQRLLEMQIRDQRQNLQIQTLQIEQLAKELENSYSADKQKEIDIKKQNLLKQKEDFELKYQEILYSKFFNSIYKGLKNDFEQVDLNIFNSSQTLEQIIFQLKTQKVNDHTYMDKIWGQIPSVEVDDLTSFNKFIAINTQNQQQINEIKQKWKVLFAKPRVEFSNGVLQISGISFSMSSVRNQYEQHLQSASEIFIVAAEQLIIDVDLIVPKTNVAIEANVILIRNSECKINTSPIDHPKLVQDKLLNNGNSIKRNPIPGKHGLAGESAGHITIRAQLEIQRKECLKLIANGSNGQDGTNGLDGYDGIIGKNGEDGIDKSKKDKPPTPDIYYQCSIYNDYKIWRGIGRGIGSDAGLGGNAGVGGEGGYPGQISVTIKNIDVEMNTLSKRGVKGKDGTEGNGGKPGQDGLNGVDCFEFHKWGASKQHTEGLLKLNKRQGWLIYDYECEVIKDKPTYAKFGKNDYSKDQNGSKKDMRGATASQQQSKMQKAIQKQSINQALLDSLFQHQMQSLTTAKTSNQLLATSQQELQQQQQNISQQIQMHNANQEIKQQLSQKQQMSQIQIQNDAKKLQENESLLVKKKQEISQIQKNQKEIAEKTEQLNKQLIQNDQKLQQINLTSQQVQQSITNEAIFDKSKLKNNDQPQESLDWEIGHTQIQLPDLEVYINIDKENLIQYLKNLKRNESSQTNLIEQFLEIIDSFILVMKKIKQQEQFHNQIKSIEESLQNIQSHGLRQTLTSLSSQITKIAVSLQQYPSKVLIEQEMLDQLIYKEHIEPEYLSMCKKNADKIYEQLMNKIQLMDTEEAINILEISISKKDNQPNTPLSKVLHFTAGVLDKFFSNDQGIQKNSFINIITEIEKMIMLLKQSKSSNDQKQQKEIKQFQIAQCTLYNHYFKRSINYKDYPLDMSMNYFNFYKRTEYFLDIINLFSNLLDDANTHSYYLPHLLGINGQTFLLTVQQNIALVYFNMEELYLIRSKFNKVDKTIKSNLGLFYPIKIQVETINLIIEQKWQKWVIANNRLNEVLIQLEIQTSITNEIYKSAMQALYCIETSSLDSLTKQIYFNRIKDILFQSTADITSEMKVKEIIENIKKKNGEEIIKIQSRQRWSIIYQNLIVICRRMRKQKADNQSDNVVTMNQSTLDIIQMSNQRFREQIVKLFSDQLQETKDLLEVLLEKFYDESFSREKMRDNEFLRNSLITISQRKKTLYYEKILQNFILKIFNTWVQLNQSSQEDFIIFEKAFGLKHSQNINLPNYLIQKCLNDQAKDIIDKFYQSFNAPQRKNFKGSQILIKNMIQQIEGYYASKIYFEKLESKIKKDTKLENKSKHVKSDFKKLVKTIYENYTNLDCKSKLSDILHECYKVYTKDYDTEMSHFMSICKMFEVEIAMNKMSEMFQKQKHTYVDFIKQAIEKNPQSIIFMIKVMDIDITKICTLVKEVILNKNQRTVQDSQNLLELWTESNQIFKERVMDDFENKVKEVLQEFEDDFIEIEASLKYNLIQTLQVLKQYAEYMYDPQGIQEFLNSLLDDIRIKGTLNKYLLEKYQQKLRVISIVKTELINKESQKKSNQSSQLKLELISISQQFNEIQKSENFDKNDSLNVANKLLQKLLEFLKISELNDEDLYHDQQYLKQILAICMLTYSLNKVPEEQIIKKIEDCQKLIYGLKSQEKQKQNILEFLLQKLKQSLIQSKKYDLFTKSVDYSRQITSCKQRINDILEIIAKLPECDDYDRTSQIDRANKNLSILMVGAFKQGILHKVDSQLKLVQSQIQQNQNEIDEKNKDSKIQGIHDIIQRKSLSFVEAFLSDGYYANSKVTEKVIQDLEDLAKLTGAQQQEYVNNQYFKLYQMLRTLQLAPLSIEQIIYLKSLKLKLDSFYYNTKEKIIKDINDEILNHIKLEKSSLLLQYERELISPKEIIDKYFQYDSQIETKYQQIYSQDQKYSTRVTIQFEELIHSQQFIVNDSLRINIAQIQNFDLLNPKKAVNRFQDLDYNNVQEVKQYFMLHLSSNENQALSPYINEQLNDIFDFLLFIGESQRQIAFQKFVQLVNDDENQDDESILMIQLVNSFKNIKNNDIHLLLSSNANQNTINQIISKDFQELIRKIRITLKLEGKTNEALHQFLSQTDRILEMNQEYRALLVKALIQFYCQKIDEDDESNFVLKQMKAAIKENTQEQQLEFIKKLQSKENQLLVDILISLNESSVTYIKRLWRIITEKRYQDWTEEVFMMTAYQVCLNWIENLEPMQDNVKGQEEYLSQRMKKVKGLLGVLTQQRLNLKQQQISQFNEVIKIISERISLYQEDEFFQISVESLQQFILLIDKRDNIEDIIMIMKQYRPKLWHQKILIYSCERALDEFIFKQNGISSKIKLQFKNKIIKGLRQIQASIGILETIKSILDEEIGSESESLFLSNDSLLDVVSKLAQLQKKQLLTDSVVYQLKGGQINDIQIQIQKILIKGDLNYSDKEPLHQKIIAGLFTFSQTYGEGKLNQLIAAVKLQKLYDPQDLLILVQKINNRQIVLGQDSLQALTQDKIMNEWVQILVDQAKDKQDIEESLQKTLSSDEKLRYDCNNLCEQIMMNDFNQGVREFVEKTNSQDDPKLTSLILQIFKAFREESKVLESSKPISKWERQDIMDWVKSEKTRDLFRDKWNQENASEIFAVAIRGIQKATNNIARHTQIACCIFFYYDLGQVGEVYTGEGKTLIITLWSIIQAIRGMKVDIMSSSSDLAVRDFNETRNIYLQFGLKSGVNCDEKANEDEESRQKKYQADIVFGDIGSFQRDYLLDSVFIGKSVRGGRTTGCLIIDEIDSSLLDKGESTLYLSHKIAELSSLKNLYVQIWASTHAKGNTKGTQDDIKVVTESLKQRIHSNNIKIPNILKSLVLRKLPEYVSNAYTAKEMNQNDPYILNMRKDNGRVVVMDKETGVEQKSTQWSNGLHQFLQLKHQDRLTPESFRAVFVSNLKYFQKYKGKIYGLTGTLGSQVERKLLNSLYSLEFFNLPRFTTSCFVQYEPITVPSLSAQLNMIKMIVKDIAVINNRPILFICENVSSVLLIEQFISEFHSQVYKRTLADETLDKGSVDELVGREVIVATNIAGRGTDLKISEQVSKKGGLHVVVTFLTSNIRIEEQAFGRTARKGQTGSGQFCIQFSNSSLSMNEIKLERDRLESYRLAELKKKTISRLELEGILFQKFTELYLKLSYILRNDINFQQIMQNQNYSEYLEMQLGFLKNRWAFFLESITDDLKEVYKKGRKIVFIHFERFKNECLINVRDQDGLKFAISYCELVKIGIFFEQNKLIKLALKAFNKAIKNEPYFCDAAYYRKAKILRVEQDSMKFFEFFDVKAIYNRIIDGQQKELERRIQINVILKRSQNLMQDKVNELLAIIQIAKVVDKNYKKKQKDVQYENLFELQIQEIIGLYNFHIESIKQSVGQLPSQDVLRELFQCYDDKLMLSNINEYFEKETDIFKLERISKKVKVQDAPCMFILNDDIIEIPFNLQYCDKEIINALKAKIGQPNFKQRYLQQSDFKDVFLSSEEVFAILIKKGYLINMKKYLQVSEFDPDNFIQLKFYSEDDKVKMMEFLLQNSGLQFDIVEFKNKLNSLSQYYDELIAKKLIQIEEKGTLIIKSNKQQMMKELDRRVFNIISEYIEHSIESGQETIEVLKGQINIQKTVEEQFLSLKMFMISKNILKQKSFNFKITNSSKERRRSIKKQVYNLIDMIDVNIQVQKNGILNHFWNIIKTTSEPIIKEQKKKKEEAYILPNLRFSSKLQVLEQQKEDFKKSFAKDILAKIGVNKARDSIEIEVIELASKFSDQKQPVPREIEEMIDYGLEKIIVIKQGWTFKWKAALVVLIGIAQIGLGFLLIATGVGATLGSALIAEGFSDIAYGLQAIYQGEFSWVDYGIQKAISLALAIITMGCSSFAGSAGGQVIKKVGISAGIKAVKKGALKAILPQIKEKVIKWTTDTLGILQTFIENIIQKVSSFLISKGMIIIETILNEFLIPLKNFISDCIKQVLDNEREEFLDKCFENMKSSFTQFLGRSKKFIELFKEGKNLAVKIVENFQQGGQSFAGKMVAALASIAQIIQSCSLIKKITKNVKKSSNIIKNTKTSFQQIKQGYMNHEVAVVQDSQKKIYDEKIEQFFIKEQGVVVKQIQNKTQKVVDEWVSDLIEEFIKDQALKPIEKKFDKAIKYYDEKKDKDKDKKEKDEKDKAKEDYENKKELLTGGFTDLSAMKYLKDIRIKIQNIHDEELKTLQDLCFDKYSAQLKQKLTIIYLNSGKTRFSNNEILIKFKSQNDNFLDIIREFGKLILDNIASVAIAFYSQLLIKGDSKLEIWEKNTKKNLQGLANESNQRKILEAAVTKFSKIFNQNLPNIDENSIQVQQNTYQDEFLANCNKNVDDFLVDLKDWTSKQIEVQMKPLLKKISDKVVDQSEKFFETLSSKKKKKDGKDENGKKKGKTDNEEEKGDKKEEKDDDKKKKLDKVQKKFYDDLKKFKEQISDTKLVQIDWEEIAKKFTQNLNLKSAQQFQNDSYSTFEERKIPINNIADDQAIISNRTKSSANSIFRSQNSAKKFTDVSKFSANNLKKHTNQVKGSLELARKSSKVKNQKANDERTAAHSTNKTAYNAMTTAADVLRVQNKLKKGKFKVVKQTKSIDEFDKVLSTLLNQKKQN
ncbi:preprotein translocase subunit-like protein [Stylonychia lemnae]|uniref:Preprotein translocase subunit-like protein n=1 Tax=Stylonychia lemnae TaxID=5949 RepID=A0A078A1D4_STYLE|nr:preprotein translocase subunit-like protein [Stylonychia lemnae]|eukprot:CDW75288.1 preprotein translocase subunit-like protein [Stylonychia lemnae]